MATAKQFMCGGTSDENDATSEIQEILDQVKPDIEKHVGEPVKELKATKYKSQVVAGTNYFIKAHIGNGKYVHARVFKSLPHAGSKLQLHSIQKDKTEAHPIEFF